MLYVLQFFMQSVEKYKFQTAATNIVQFRSCPSWKFESLGGLEDYEYSQIRPHIGHSRKKPFFYIKFLVVDYSSNI